MSSEERAAICKINEEVNIYREDYFNSEAYQNGMNWDRANSDNEDYRNWLKELRNYLNINAPRSLLEIGPGSGYYSSFIFGSGIRNYYGAEINPKFVEYLQPRMSESGRLHNVDVTLYCGEIKTIPDIKVDSVVILSALHHIPDRYEMFKLLDEKLNSNGTFLAIEPTHYLPRIAVLIGRIIRQYHKVSFWGNLTNLSTHHFLTRKEFDSIGRRLNWRIDYEAYRFPRRVARLFKILGFIGRESDDYSFFNNKAARILKLFSIECVISLRKNSM